MRILQVINHLDKGGGAEQFVHDIVLSFLREGHKVTVLNVYRSPNNQLLDSVKEAGAKIQTLGEKRLSITSFFKLMKMLKSRDYDIVHVHLFPALYYCGIAKLLSFSRIPLVYTEHSTKNRRRGSKFFKYADSIVYSQYNKVVCITEAVKDALCNHVPAIKPIVINNGVNIQCINERHALDVRKMLNIPNDTILLIMIGRLVKGKDYSTVFKTLKSMDNRFHFLCVGDGPLKEQFENEIVEDSLNDRVHLLGLRTDVIELIKGCDLAILSTEHEGFSISMLEVMACAKPFIASSVPGITDLVSDYALLFPYKDSNALKLQIQKCITDKNVYEDFSKRSYLFASRFDITKTAQSYMDVYQSITK